MTPAGRSGKLAAMHDINIGDLVLDVNFIDGYQTLGMVVRKQNGHQDPAYEWWNVEWYTDKPDATISGYNTNSIISMKENLKLIYGK